ncbi:MAG: RNA polymerase sigma factor [Myxococcota bacterium]
MVSPNPGTERSDLALLSACAEGDAEALLELHRRHADRLHRYLARALGLRSGDVEDGVQQVFLVVWTRAGAFRPRSHASDEVRAWLFGIATNVAREHRRRRVRRLRAIEQLSALPLLRPPRIDDQLSQRQLVQRAIDGLDELSDPLRETYLICDVEGLSGPEAARALGVRPGTLRRRLHEARRRLRALLVEGLADE